MEGNAWLIVPTYNEAENVEPLVEAARAALAESVPGAFRILVVDDDSPDGTGADRRPLAAEHDDVEVLHRFGREGLGPAYVAGFRRALAGGDELRARDGRRLLPRPGGSEAPARRRRGGRRRRARLALRRGRPRRGLGPRCGGSISRGGCVYARSVLGLEVHDLTGGFKCLRREVLEAIDLDTIRSHGYSFQIELTSARCERGFTVREVPIVFRDRRHGHSKMSPGSRSRRSSSSPHDCRYSRERGNRPMHDR